MNLGFEAGWVENFVVRMQTVVDWEDANVCRWDVCESGEIMCATR